MASIANELPEGDHHKYIQLNPTKIHGNFHYIILSYIKLQFSA